ncbi:MAG: Hsp33 family molecular chaperone HslO, partial [Ruminococcaceae bacterium]|nr:Hsp33 family molecular chaperone HslO [Oscillospiraceae bacterium]
VGVFAEELPGSNDLRKVWDSVKPFFRVLDEEELKKSGCEKLGESELMFGCHCSKRSAQRIIETLPKEERASLGPTAEVVCKFCGRKYEVENE